MDSDSPVGKAIAESANRQANDFWPFGLVWPAEIMPHNPAVPFTANEPPDGCSIAYYLPMSMFGSEPERFVDMLGSRETTRNKECMHIVHDLDGKSATNRSNYLRFRTFLVICEWLWRAVSRPTADESALMPSSESLLPVDRATGGRRARSGGKGKLDWKTVHAYIACWNREHSDAAEDAGTTHHVAGTVPVRGRRMWIETRMRQCVPCLTAVGGRCNMCKAVVGGSVPRAVDYLLVFTMTGIESAEFRTMCMDAIRYIVPFNYLVPPPSEAVTLMESLDYHPKTIHEWNTMADNRSNDNPVNPVMTMIEGEFDPSDQFAMTNPMDAYRYELMVQTRESAVDPDSVSPIVMRWEICHAGMANINAFLCRYLPDIDIVARRPFEMMMPHKFFSDPFGREQKWLEDKIRHNQPHNKIVPYAPTMEEPTEHMMLHHTAVSMIDRITRLDTIRYPHIHDRQEAIEAAGRDIRCVRILLSRLMFWKYSRLCCHRDAHISSVLRETFTDVDRSSPPISSATAIRPHEYMSAHLDPTATPVFRQFMPDLDVYAQYKVNQADDLMNMFKTDADHIFPTLRSILICYLALRFGKDYHPVHVLNSRVGSGGKSYIVEYVLQNGMIFRCTIQPISRTSNCHTSLYRMGGDDDVVYWYDEAKLKDLSDAEAYSNNFKSWTTTQQNTSVVLAFGPDGRRRKDTIVNQSIHTAIYCTNIDTSQLSDPVLTRTLCDTINRHTMLTEAHKRTRSVAGQNIPPHASSMYRQVHLVQIHLNKLIQDKCVEPVTMVVDHLMTRLLEDRLRQHSSLSVSPRAWSNVSNLAYALCLEDIWVRHFASPGGAFFGLDVTPDRLRMLDSQLYITVQHWSIAAGLVAPCIFGDAKHRIRRAILSMWKRAEEIPMIVRWHRMFDADMLLSSESDMDHRAAASAPSEEIIPATAVGVASRMLESGSGSSRSSASGSGNGGIRLSDIHPSLPPASGGPTRMTMYTEDYNMVLFMRTAVGRDQDVMQRFATAVLTEINRDTGSPISPPTIQDIQTVLGEWCNTPYVGRKVVKRIDNPKCIPPGSEADYSLSTVESETYSGMACTVDASLGITFMTAFLADDVSPSEVVRKYVTELVQQNHGACVRTLDDAGATNEFRRVGGVLQSRALYGKPRDERVHMYDSIPLSEDNRSLEAFKFEYDVLRQNVPDSIIDMLTDDNPGEHRGMDQITWPYSMDHMAILSRQKTGGVMSPPCSSSEFLRTVRRYAFPTGANVKRSGMIATYMGSIVPGVRFPGFVIPLDARIWDTTAWPTIMMWSLFLGVPPSQLEDPSVWCRGIDDIDFCLAHIQPREVEYLEKIWNHPCLQLREWFHSPEAQNLLFRRAVHALDPDTPMGRMYKSELNVTYAKRTGPANADAVFIRTEEIAGTAAVPMDVQMTNGHSTPHAYSDDGSLSSPLLTDSSEQESTVDGALNKRRRHTPGRSMFRSRT